MKTPSDKILLATIAAPLLAAVMAQAQNYSITSHAIASGGGVCNGGGYSITGTAGQHDGSPTSSGGAYAISGGFLSQYMALQQIGAPRIFIRGAGTNVQVVWGSNVPGWVLQSNAADLNSASWQDVAGAPTVNGAEQFHQFNAGSGGRVFFRLRKL